MIILCKCVGSSGHSLLAHVIIQNSHELALKVWPDPFTIYFWGRVISLATADNRGNQFGPRSGSSEKIILKKASRRQKNIKRGYTCKEAFNAQAISAILRRAVKCSFVMANLLRITLALFGHSCNKYLIIMCRCVTGV